MQIIKQGIVFESQPAGNRQSCCFSGTCALTSGRWLVTCRAAPAKEAMVGQHVLFRYSDDEGETWSDVYNPFGNVPDVDGKPGVFRAAYVTELDDGQLIAVLYWLDHSDPELEFFNAETNGLLNSKIMLSYSGDQGESWTDPLLIDTSSIDMALPITGPILQMTGGELACHFEQQKHYYSSEEWRHTSAMVFLKNKGPEWEGYVAVSSDPENRVFYWDQRPNVMPDGRLIDLFWTYNKHENYYLDIHGKESFDNGRTWSDFWDTGVGGQPGIPIGLDDGRIFMPYVDRSANPVIKGRISHDNGRSFPDDTEALLFSTHDFNQDAKKGSMEEAWDEMNKFTLGLPTPVKLPGNNVLMTFYNGTSANDTSIHWMKLEV